MSPFKSYFMGGFECADHINRHGVRVNLLKETQHDTRVEEDYRLLHELGIHTVREGICWSSVEKTPNRFDFSEVLVRLRAGEKYQMQQIWDLIHFGYPDDIFPGHPKFAERFQNLCRAFAHFYQEYSTQPLWVVPINEISFLAWHAGEAKGTVPFATNNGWEIKYHLCQAAILGIEILKEEIPDCRVILVEPLIAIHDSETSDSQQVFEANEHQFQAMDMIAGRLCPELNGKEEYLDILGLNYYWNCQWQFGGETLVWPELEPRRIPLRHLLTKVYQRYQKPIFLSETGHIGVGRAQWLKEVATECRALQTQGVPFYGICLYPVVDRPNWDNLHEYHDCGIFDVDLNLNRQPHFELISSIKKIQAAITTSLGQRHPPLTALTGIKRELTPQD